MSDPLFSSVALLLPLDSNVNDVSNDAHTVTAQGNAAITASQSKFGGGSLQLDGNGDYLTLENAATLSLGTDDFTIEAWVRLNSLASNNTIFAIGNTFSSTGFLWNVNTSGGFQVFGANGNIIADTSGTGTMSTGIWYHVALTRDGDDWAVFLDGVQQGTAVNSGSYPNSATTYVGNRNYGGASGDYFDGWIDDFRITIGIARYETSFTPPTEAHPTSDGPVIRLDSPTPLANIESVVAVANPIQALISSPPPIAPALLASSLFAPRFVRVEVPSPIGAVRLRSINDFSALITPSPEIYVAKITGDPIVSLAISSWQGTIQNDRQDYLQCVLPNYVDYASDIASRQGVEEVAVYRITEVNGEEYEAEIARVPLTTVAINSGPFRQTATLSGYSDSETLPPAAGSIVLSGVTQTSTTLAGGSRIRCDINYFLRPGQEVSGGDLTLTVDYINYFVPSSGVSYMDVGSRG